MDLQRVLAMKKGVGESSYFSNSKIQGVIISKTRSVRQEAAAESFLQCAASCQTMSVADLGCSSGPTAVLVVAELVEVIQRKCQQLQRPPPDFHLLLNDLYGNDFNTVFQSLPDFYRRMRLGNGRCFISAVPGSFYGRLFPSRSLHLVHSSSSLHWLSEVPQELQRGSAAYLLNKGKVYLSKSSPPRVLEAYWKQFQSDFTFFLKCRAEELVAGGRMVLTLTGRKNADPTAALEDSYYWELLADALNDMAAEGLLEEEMIDCFNAPYYSPSVEELKQLVEGEGSFSIRRLERFEAGWESVNDGDYKTTPQSYAQGMAKGVRAVLESILKSHFGDNILDDLFSRYSSLLESYYSLNKAEIVNIVVDLVKKG